MFHKILLLIFLTFQLSWSQDFSRNWKSHFSYSNIVAADASESNIYAAAGNSIFIHSIAENTNSEFTTVNGLSAEEISVIEYIEERGLIIVGFSNGLIEIIDEETNQIRSLNDITNQINFPPDQIKINDFFVDDTILYIATGFGIVEYNLDNNVFINTYLLSDSIGLISDIVGVGVIGDFIITSVANRGTFIGNKRDRNLIQFSNWNLIQPEVFIDYKLFSGQLIVRNSNSLLRYNGSNFSNLFTDDTSNILTYSTSRNQILISLANKLITLNGNFEVIEQISLSDELTNNIDNGRLINNEIYFSSEGRGFLKTVNRSIEAAIVISPDGPLSNSPYAIEAKNGDLWICYGDISRFYAISPTSFNNGISRLRNNDWLTIPFESFETPYIVDIQIDPTNNERVFFSSYSEGLLEYFNGTFTKFDTNNSNIDEGSFGREWVFQLAFDNNNRLWYTNGLTNNLINRFSTSDEGTKIDFSTLFSDSEFKFNFNGEELTFDQNNNIYFGSLNNGLIGYNSSSRELVALSDPELNNIPFESVRGLAVDLEGQLWIGTNLGLRTIPNPASIFNTNGVPPRAESIIIEDDGVPQEFLIGQFVSEITVDSENNKWIATVGGGVFQLAANGESVLQQFTTENSPLPSNNINQISIDDSTGIIYIATDRGIVQFQSNIVETEENLDKFRVFPNPVRPEYGDINVRIEGLTAGANVKITDIEGNLVFEDQNPVVNGTGSGLIEWNTRSFSGKKVASGVYLILITSEDQSETNVGKLLIVR